MKRVIGRIERILHASAERLRRAPEPGAAAFWMLDVPPRGPGRGESGEQHSGGSGSNWLTDAAAVLETLDPPDRDRVADALRGGPVPLAGISVRARHGDGSVRTLRLRTLTAVAERGAQVRICVVDDISAERDRADHVTHLHQQLRTQIHEIVIAEEAERHRLAQDLHDTVGQALALARIRIDQLADGADRDGLDEVRDLVSEAERRVANTTFALSPPMLHDLGLSAALEWLAEDTTARHGLEVAFHARGAAFEADRHRDILLYRSVREVLFNALKHAAAARADVTITAAPGAITIVVSDDGCGFEPAQLDEPGHDGFGLFSIRERLSHLGGILRLDSAPGRGTTVHMRVPRADAPTAAART